MRIWINAGQWISKSLWINQIILLTPSWAVRLTFSFAKRSCRTSGNQSKRFRTADAGMDTRRSTMSQIPWDRSDKSRNHLPPKCNVYKNGPALPVANICWWFTIRFDLYLAWNCFWIVLPACASIPPEIISGDYMKTNLLLYRGEFTYKR